MESEDQDDRSDTAKSMDLAMQVVVISMMFALPPAAGAWIDSRLQSGALFLIVGLFVGMGVAAFQLYRLVARMSRKVVIDKSKLIDLSVDAETSDPDSKAGNAEEGRSELGS